MAKSNWYNYENTHFTNNVNNAQNEFGRPKLIFKIVNKQLINVYKLGNVKRILALQNVVKNAIFYVIEI